MVCLFLVPVLFFDVCVTCDNDAGLLKPLAWCRGDGLLTPTRHASGRERGGTKGVGTKTKTNEKTIKEMMRRRCEKIEKKVS